MKPVYFPFTFISRPVVEAVSACFRQIVVYQPSGRTVPEQMQKWAESGMLEIRIPVKEDEERLEAVLKDYRDWINLHQGSEIAFLKTLKAPVPYFDESSTSKIRADIRKKIEEARPGNELSLERNVEILQARIFLLSAQELDLQNLDITQDLLKFEEIEKDLFENLRGEIEDSDTKAAGNKALLTDDPGNYMAPERLAAWVRLMLHDQMQTNCEITGLYITSSRPVFEYLTDDIPGVQKALGFDSIPVYKKRPEAMEIWQDRLLEHLNMLAKSPWPPPPDSDIEPYIDEKSDKKVSLAIYIVPGQEPLEFFSRFMKNRPFQEHGTDEGRGLKNTLIGFVQF